MGRPDALRLALRPSSVLLTLAVLLAAGVAVKGDLESSPIVRLEVDMGGPLGRAAPPDVAPSSAPVLSRYRVRPGDTLVGVAVLHDVDEDVVARANGLHPPYPLAAGAVLRIPDVPSGPPPPPPPTAKTGVADLIAWWADRADVGRRLLQAVTWRESAWRQDAVSERGALGIGQLLPATAEWVADRLAGGAPLDPHNLEHNVELAARYLRWLVDRADGDVAAALAAYHQGPEAVARDGWYPSTLEYVRDVFRLRRGF